MSWQLSIYQIFAKQILLSMQTLKLSSRNWLLRKVGVVLEIGYEKCTQIIFWMTIFSWWSFQIGLFARGNNISSDYSGKDFWVIVQWCFGYGSNHRNHLHRIMYLLTNGSDSTTEGSLCSSIWVHWGSVIENRSTFFGSIAQIVIFLKHQERCYGHHETGYVHT